MEKLKNETDLLSLINKPSTEFSIPLNSLRTQAPTNAPAQNASLGNKFLSSIGAGLENGLGKIFTGPSLASIGSFITSGEGLNGVSKTMSLADSAINTAGDIASNFGPIGAAVGAGVKLINTIGGNLIRTPKNIKEYSVNDNISSSYGGILSDSQDTQSNVDSYKKSGLFGKLIGRKRLKRQVDEANSKQYAASKLTDQQNKIKNAASNSMDLLSQNVENKLRKKSNNESSILLSKNGGKLPKFRYGGSIIVTGSLHARKHNINKNSKILKGIDITDKGVPLIVIKKDGGEMVAEFEKEELILRKSIVKEIIDLKEEIGEDKSKEENDEIYFEIGKILAKEILSHTKDKDGLIDTIE